MRSTAQERADRYEVAGFLDELCERLSVWANRRGVTREELAHLLREMSLEGVADWWEEFMSHMD